MADNNNLNLLSQGNNEPIDIEQNPNFVDLTLRQKEATFHIPLNKVEEFIINGIKNIICQGKFLKTTAEAAYYASVNKSSEIINNLSELVLEAFNEVNKNLSLISNEIKKIDSKIINLEEKCHNMWDDHDDNHKENEKRMNDFKEKYNENIKKCVDLCNNSKKKVDEINNNMAGNSKNLNSKYEELNNNIKEYNKKLNIFEQNVKMLNEKKLIFQNYNNDIKNINDKIKELENKINKNNEPLSMSNIKFKDKKIEDINIDENILKNSNKKTMKFNISVFNNTISFKNCTDICDDNKESNNYLDKVKIIFNLGIKDKNMIYQIDKIKDKWDFKRNMKYIWRRLYNVDFRRRFKVKFNNLKYVYIMKYTDKQIQFIKREATLYLIKRRNFFVKIKNKFVFVAKNNIKNYSRNNFKPNFINNRNKFKYNNNIKKILNKTISNILDKSNISNLNKSNYNKYFNKSFIINNKRKFRSNKYKFNKYRNNRRKNFTYKKIYSRNKYKNNSFISNNNNSFNNYQNRNFY